MQLKREKRKTSSIRLSVNENGREIGRLFLYLIKNDLHDKPYALIEDVLVDEKARGRGIGSRLIKEALDECRDSNCYKIIACSRNERGGVHRFYTKNGFKKYGFEFRIDL